MRFEGLLERQERGELRQEAAAEMLGASERTFRPHGSSLWAAAAEEILGMPGLYEERYEGFGVKHFREQLQKRHHYKLRLHGDPAALAGGGVGAAGAAALGASQEAAAAAVGRDDAASEPALAKAGDASRYAWLPGDDRQYDLVVTLGPREGGDATSAIYSAFVVEEEGTLSSFRALAEVIDRHGVFCELYTDRGSHYFHTPKAGEAVSKSVQTQSLPRHANLLRRNTKAGVGRALAQLGIRHIAAYSPEARGRSERAFRTSQDRLRKTACPKS